MRRCRVLRRVPVHMSYNVTALDRGGRWATVYLAPDQRARRHRPGRDDQPPGQVEWAPYAAAIRSVERQERLEELLRPAPTCPASSRPARSPLYATRFPRARDPLHR